MEGGGAVVAKTGAEPKLDGALAGHGAAIGKLHAELMRKLGVHGHAHAIDLLQQPRIDDGYIGAGVKQRALGLAMQEANGLHDRTTVLREHVDVAVATGVRTLAGNVASLVAIVAADRAHG